MKTGACEELPIFRAFCAIFKSVLGVLSLVFLDFQFVASLLPSDMAALYLAQFDVPISNPMAKEELVAL